MSRKLGTWLALGSLIGALSIVGGTAGTANADVCTSYSGGYPPGTLGNDMGQQFNRVCLYYNTGFTGSQAMYFYDPAGIWGFSASHDGNTPYFTSIDVFYTPGAGHGQGVKNNAAAWNNIPGDGTGQYDPNNLYSHLCYNSWFHGAQVVLPPWTGANLIGTPLYNEDASIFWQYGS